MTTVRNWWWAGVAFVYPLLWAPWSSSRSAAYVVHIGFLGFAVVGAMALAWGEGRDVPLLAHVRRVGTLLSHPPLLVALAFAVWVTFCDVFSPAPGIALTGSLTELGNGSYEYLLLFVVFALVYAQVRAEPGLSRRIAFAVVASGAVLATAAFVEVLTKHPIVARGATAANLPMVVFPQKGHLAGMLAMSGGIAIGDGALGLVLLIAAGVGLTLNRSAAFVLALPLALRRPRRLPRVALTVAAVLVGLGAGALLAKSPQVGATKAIVSGGTLRSRGFLWRSAVRGIAARPLVGWGGGVFEQHWADFLSLDELSGYVHAEWGFGPVLKRTRAPGGYPLLLVRVPSGRGGAARSVRPVPIVAWHSHNQFLEVGLMAGLVGLALYCVLLWFGVRGAWQGNPLSLGLLAYFVFLQLWFVIPETRGLLWVVWAAAVASTLPRDPVQRRG